MSGRHGPGVRSVALLRRCWVLSTLALACIALAEMPLGWSAKALAEVSELDRRFRGVTAGSPDIFGFRTLLYDVHFSPR